MSKTKKTENVESNPNWLEDATQKIAEGANQFGWPNDYVRLPYDRIGASGVVKLGPLLRDPRVRILDLWENELCDEGIKTLAAILPETQITELTLGNNNIGDAGIKALADVLPYTNIEKLWLHFNNIGDEGIAALSAILPQTRIKELSIWKNEISNVGAQTLIDAIPQSQIIDFSHTSDNHIDNDHGRRIHALVKENVERNKSGEMPPPAPALPAPQIIETASVAKALTAQRRAALEEGQGI